MESAAYEESTGLNRDTLAMHLFILLFIYYTFYIYILFFTISLGRLNNARKQL